MGSDQAEKNEIDPRALARADIYVCDRASQAEALGELRTALAKGTWTRGKPPELGAVVAGATPGRHRPEDITICDLTGTGAQDTAIATHALVAARAVGAGTVMRA
jgi:ornithine cyclodeaminase